MFTINHMVVSFTDTLVQCDWQVSGWYFGAVWDSSELISIYLTNKMHMCFQQLSNVKYGLVLMGLV